MDRRIVMTKLVMSRAQGDNHYLHRDFHILLNNAIDYLDKHFGHKGICEFLEDYAHSYFKPMILSEINDYFVNLFLSEEKGEYIITNLSSCRLDIEITKCPAIEYIREMKQIPSKWFYETTKTLYKSLAEISKTNFILHEYNSETGAAKFSFEECV